MGMAPLNNREGSCITAQRSTRIRKKLKSVPENAFLMRSKRGSISVSKIKKEKPKSSWHQGVYAQHASKDKGVIRGDGRSSYRVIES